MMPGVATAGSEGELVREALDALLEIAWEETPPEVQAALRQQVAELTPEEREHMLDGFVDREVLSRLLADAAQGQTITPELPEMDSHQVAMVDAALDPLTRMVQPEAERVLGQLGPGERAHILFAAVERRG